MKVKFTKLAALLLAGAALLASGCTDYEVDIQKANQRIDQLDKDKATIAELNSQIEALKALVASTYETIAAHDADVAKLNKTISDLETALKEDYQKKIQDAVNTLNAAIDKKLDITTFNAAKTQIEEAIADANRRIKAIEDADFQKQINDLATELRGRISSLENLLAGDWDGKTVKQTIDAVKQSVIDLESSMNGKIQELWLQVNKNTEAIKTINDEKIPALQRQIDAINTEIENEIKPRIKALEDGKLDRSEFDAYYKSAYERLTKATIDAIQADIKALQALTAGFPEDTTIKEYIDKADQILKDDITAKYLTLVAAAFGTEENLKNLEGNLLGRLQVLEALLAGDWAEGTVQQYIDKKAQALQAQIDDINNVKLPALDERVTALESSMATVLETLEFVKKVDDDGKVSYDLKGYIDDAALKAYKDACAYTDEYIEFLIDQLNEIFAEIYNLLDLALSRIQSIQFVPEYDDLKITSNMSWFTQPGSNLALPVDQPTKVTYQFLPAQYAPAIARGIEQNVANWYNTPAGPWTREEAKGEKYTDYAAQDDFYPPADNSIIAFFDVRPVGTRAGEATVDAPRFHIVGVDKVDANTGEITFIVQPENVASAAFEANGIKPYYIFTLDRDYYGNRGQDGGMYYGSYIPDWDPEYYYTNYGDVQWPAYDTADIEAFENRAAFAAQLRLYHLQEYFVGDIDFEALFSDPEYEIPWIDYENELASPYNVLYPAVLANIELDGDAYRPELDADGEPKTKTIGDVDVIVLEKATPEHQTLPYSALRKDGDDAIGEDPAQDPKGYRVILDQAVPGIVIDGVNDGNAVTIADAAKLGYFVPPITVTFDKFTYSNNDHKDLFKETAQVYAEIEMNDAKNAALRKAAVGDLITGIYNFTSVLGAVPVQGDVRITKPEGHVNVAAEIKWTYSFDADVDHARFEPSTGKYTNPGDYSRAAVKLTPDPETAAVLLETLGVGPADFSGKHPIDGVYTVKNAAGETVTSVTISNVAVTGGNITADFVGFEWDETYTIEAKYDLDAAEVTVNLTLTTVDRNRELIVITLDKYNFILNGADYDAATDRYTSQVMEFQKPLFDKFVANGIINQGTPKDFADENAFIGADNNGKEGHLVAASYEDNSTFIVIGDDNATLTLTSPELKEVMGMDLSIYVNTYIGQEVKIIIPVDVDLPAYDFLHLSLYTFNTAEEFAGSSMVPFMQKRDFTENSATDKVLWWTQVLPSYYNDVPNATAPLAPADRVSNRYALADYDVAYINLAELAFNVVDENDDVMDDAAIAAANLVVKFDYKDDTQGAKPLPAEDVTAEYAIYDDLWKGPTTFYYRTNEKPFIRMKGSLAILSGETEFPLVTRFDEEKASVKYPEVGLIYTNYALVRWTPFKAPVTKDIEIVLDENKIYRQPLLEGIELSDQRPNGTTFFVIKNGEWVIGDAAADATADSGTNGYLNGVSSKDAYHIDADVDYSDVMLPVELQKLLRKETVNGVPYIVYDYTSETQFQGVITIPVAVTLTNPWQKELTFSYNLIIKGFND